MLLLEKQLKKKTILITMKLVLVYLCLLPTLKEKKHYFLKVILYCQQDWIDAMAVSYMLPAPCEQNPERHIFFFFFIIRKRTLVFCYPTFQYRICAFIFIKILFHEKKFSKVQVLVM